MNWCEAHLASAHVRAVLCWLSMSKRYYCRKNRFTLPEHKNCLTHFFLASCSLRSSAGASPFQLTTRALQLLCCFNFSPINLDDLLFLMMMRRKFKISFCSSWSLRTWDCFSKNFIESMINFGLVSRNCSAPL